MTAIDKVSEVELNKSEIKVGFVLYYCDASNVQKWIVTKLFCGGFEAKDDFETKDFHFNELQIGWIISEKNKVECNL